MMLKGFNHYFYLFKNIYIIHTFYLFMDVEYFLSVHGQYAEGWLV